MSEKHDGGPAFPVRAIEGERDESCGMTLRDWFAGQMAAACVSRGDGYDPRIRATDIAAIAYGLADTMLAERAKAR